MFDRILFPTDGSEGAASALEYVLDVAAGHDATLVILHVTDAAASDRGEDEDGVTDAPVEDDEVVAEAASQARARGIETEAVVRRGTPYREIVDGAADESADVVAIPTHGRQGLERFLLGSTAERVIRRSDVPVLSIHPDGDLRHPHEDVLVPTDGSNSADSALDVAVAVTAAESATLHLLSVVELSSLGVDVRSDLQVDILEDAAESILESAVETVDEAGLEDYTTTTGYGTSIYRAILDERESIDADLIVVGTHGRSGLERYLVGSVTEYLVRTSPVPVLSVRAPETADSE